jgi:hypothetical protein
MVEKLSDGYDISKAPKLITFGISLAITFAVGTTIGVLNHEVSALIPLNPCDAPRSHCE